MQVGIVGAEAIVVNTDAQDLLYSDADVKMLIGKEGFMIKKIGMAVRKELEQASGKQVFVDLQVQINPHWQETF